MREIFGKVLDEIHGAWRFRWYGAAVAWGISILGWAWVVSLPSIYRADATVYVDTSSVLKPILNSQIISTDITTQLTYVRQALLGRTHLERMLKENNLDSPNASPVQHESAVDDLLSAINIDVTSTRGDNSIYAISYRNSKRDTAVGVVATLLKSLVDDTRGAKQQGTDTAEKFLDDRIREYENRLQTAETTRADFQKRNADRLPGSQGGYFDRMRIQRDTLDATQKSLRLARSKHDQLIAQLNSESPMIPTGATVRNEPPPNSLDARIRDTQVKLDSLLLQYTEKHPDVIATRESLRRLQEQRTDQLKVLGVSGPDQELSRLDSNPIHQALQIALNENNVEIAGLEVDVRERSEQLRQLQALIDEVPEVEAELARLNRDYDVVYQQYQALIRSRETQDLSRKASDTDQVDFRVINPPFASSAPVSPKRFLLLAAVFVVAIGAGGGLCWLLSQLRPVFNTLTQLRELSGYPVLGVVSQAWSVRESARRLGSLLSFVGTIAVLFLVFAAAAAFEVAGPGLHTLMGRG